jgi:hypothetical protein
MPHHLRTEITIDAPTETVWSILTDLDRYESWNPFVVSSAGTVREGERLINRIQPPGSKPQTFKPTVTEVVPGRTFEWLGHLGFRGLFDGRHRFDLEPTSDGGTRLIHQEFFTGILVPLFRSTLDGKTKNGFEAMNLALKEQAEIR